MSRRERSCLTSKKQARSVYSQGGLFTTGFCGDLGPLAEALGSLDEFLCGYRMTWDHSEGPVVMIVKFEWQKYLADEVDPGPLVYGSGDLTRGLEGLVLGVFNEDAIFSVPSEGKGGGSASFLDLVYGDQCAGWVGADSDGSLDTAGEDDER